MFGLNLAMWVLYVVLIVIYNRSARRHKKRAEVYRKQIEELQVERAKVMAEYESLAFGKYKTDMADALLIALAGAEVETKYGVNRSKNPPLSD